MKNSKGNPNIFTQFTDAAASFTGTAAAKYRAYLERENQKIRNEQAAVKYNNTLALALQEYNGICTFVVDVLEKNAATLGVLAPGYPEAVAVQNWFRVNEQGLHIFNVKIKCRASNTVSQRALWIALQDTFDTYSHFNGLPRLFIGGLTACGDGVFVAAISWRWWQ